VQQHREGMVARDHRDGHGGAHDARAEDPQPREVAQPDVRERDRDEGEHDLREQRPNPNAYIRLGARSAPWIVDISVIPYRMLSR
jgi:hypothetical protein